MVKLLYIDLFCGAGGTSTGVELARYNGEKCARVVACVNHDANAIASHAANHPEASHFTEDIRTLDIKPLRQRLQNEKRHYPFAKVVLWASLECTNFSKAKGGLPRDADSRTLAEHLFRYVEAINPDFIQIENVEEFMCWGELDCDGKPLSKHKGSCYISWVNRMCAYGYHYDFRILNAADFGAYTSRKRYFGQFAKKGLTISFPKQTHARKKKRDTLGQQEMFSNFYKPWRPVRDVLDLTDSGESIFGRKKPLCEATLKRILAGLVKFVAGGNEAFLVKYNSMNQNGKYKAPSVDDPCPVIATQSRIGIAKVQFLSKQFSGAEASKNIGIDVPAGTITTIDHHAFVTAYYGNGHNHSINTPSPTLTTKDRLGLVNYQFLINEYSGGGQTGSLDNACPAVLTTPKQKIVTCDCFLMNPQFNSKGASIDKPCFTLIARMDKRPPYIVHTKQGIGVLISSADSVMTKEIKRFMAMYGIIDIRLRMLKVSELKAIMGFPKDYHLTGTISEQKKHIGNAVEVGMAKAMCEALAAC